MTLQWPTCGRHKSILFNCTIRIKYLTRLIVVLLLITIHFLHVVFFLQAADQEFDLPVKEKADICTIMYTSGTTGDPKGVLISNASIICLIAGVDRLLNRVNEKVRCSGSSCIMQPYLTHWITFKMFNQYLNFSWQKAMFTCLTFLLRTSLIVLWKSCLFSMVPLLDSGVG